MRSRTRFQAPNVVVVDDDGLLLQLMTRSLERVNVRCTTASSYAEAMELVGSFRVGVFDIELGDGSGVDVAGALVEAGRVSHCIFFTGGASREQLERAGVLGEIFSKGAGVSEVVRRVGELIAMDNGPGVRRREG